MGKQKLNIRTHNHIEINLGGADLEVDISEAFEMLLQKPLRVILSNLLPSHYPLPSLLAMNFKECGRERKIDGRINREIEKE